MRVVMRVEVGKEEGRKESENRVDSIPVDWTICSLNATAKKQFHQYQITVREQQWSLSNEGKLEFLVSEQEELEKIGQ